MIRPYILRPAPPRVGLMLPDGTVVDTDGEICSEADDGFRAYAPARWGAALAADGVGELLMWNSTPIRWRRRHAEDWTPSRSDVILVNAEFPDDPDDIVSGLQLVSEFCAYYGAQLAGTLSAASMSLLRASIDADLWLGVTAPKVIPMGGRQEMTAPGIRTGAFTHWDIPAAYASTLGAVRYGGWWRPRSPDVDQLEAVHRNGTLVYAHATVRVPSDLPHGPLPRRPRRRHTLWEQMLLPLATDARPTYPTGRTVTGTWSWHELSAARRQGCSVVVDAAWAHVVPFGRTPFALWWTRITEGRSFGGLAGTLVKMMGNAMIGRFFDAPGRRQLRWWEKRGGFAVRDLAVPHYMGSSAPDLAEQVTGSVRAALGLVLNDSGARLLCAHTDGGWFVDDGGHDTGARWGNLTAYPWRAKEVAHRIDILGPSRMAVHGPGGIDYRYAGSDKPRRSFGEDWQRTFRTPYNPGDPVVDPRDAELWAGVDAR